MRLRHAFVACALAGCGSVSDNSNNIDAPVVVDTTGPTVMSSGPSNNATGASILTPIAVLFDEELDPATVTAENVKVTYLQLTVVNPYFTGGFDDGFTEQIWPGSLNQPVFGDVSYDPELKKVLFTPKAPLVTGQTYTVSLTGVKDVAGNAYAGMPIKFQTLVNAEAHRYPFNTSTGVPFGYIEFSPDMTTGRWTRQGQRNAPGADGLWHTSDDPLNQLVNINFATDGRINEERVMSPGTDAMLGTADDVPGASIFYKYDSNNKLTERALMNGPGPDMMYGTADDSVYNITTLSYNGAELSATTTFNTAGTDTAWRTADDKCSFQQDPVSMAGRKQRDVIKDCGADALPKTADDKIVKYREYTYDANGLLTAIAFRTDIGPDNIWFTSDDRGGTQVKFDRDANGRITKTTNMVIGADNKWATADDDIASYDTVTLDTKGLPTEDMFFSGKGVDAMWNTADDVVSSYITTTYDARGARISAKTFVVGVDGMAKTADDRKQTESNFDTSR